MSLFLSVSFSTGLAGFVLIGDLGSLLSEDLIFLVLDFCTALVGVIFSVSAPFFGSSILTSAY
jgi:hypothetical protein